MQITRSNLLHGGVIRHVSARALWDTSQRQVERNFCHGYGHFRRVDQCSCYSFTLLFFHAGMLGLPSRGIRQQTPARLLTFFLVRVAPSGGPADASPSGGPSHSPAGGRAGQRSRPKAHREQTTFTWWWASVPSGEAKLGVCYQRCAPGASGQHFVGQCFGESVTTGTSFRV